jgi:hypothetical protein
LHRKLGINVGHRVAIVRAPEGFEAELDPLPEGVRLRTQSRAGDDVIVFFVTRRAELERRFAKLVGGLRPSGGLWIAWPKRTARVATDLSEGVVREVGAAAGAQDTKACAISDAWSAVRFVPAHDLVSRNGT